METFSTIVDIIFVVVMLIYLTHTTKWHKKIFKKKEIEFVEREFSVWKTSEDSDYQKYEMSRSVADWILKNKLCQEEVNPLTKRKKLVIKIKVEKNEKVD